MCVSGAEDSLRFDSYAVSPSFQSQHSSKVRSRHDPLERIPTEDEFWFELMELILKIKICSAIVLANPHAPSPLTSTTPLTQTTTTSCNSTERPSNRTNLFHIYT